MTAAARVRDLAVASAVTGWLVATGLSQHPNRAFDRLRAYDRTGTMLPNWRFFAPEPAMHDFRVLHRTVTTEDVVSPWAETNLLARRCARQSVWFPDRRRDKAISDVCNEIISQLNVLDRDVVRLPSYLLLRDFVRHTAAAALPTGAEPPRGFQFVVARAGGYDEEIEPEYLFASPYEQWTARAGA